MSGQAAVEKPTIKITGLSFERELIDASGSDVDPDWVFVDADGNKHRWQKDADGLWQLPTLERRVTVLPSFDELGKRGENEQFVEYYAPATGERVHPGTRYVTRHVQGTSNATAKFVSDAIHPFGDIPLGDCAFPSSFKVTAEDLSKWILIVTECKKIGPGHYRGEGVLARRVTG